eukprot:1070431-Pyramimonas_sp.AAC.1
MPPLGPRRSLQTAPPAPRRISCAPIRRLLSIGRRSTSRPPTCDAAFRNSTRIAPSASNPDPVLSLSGARICSSGKPIASCTSAAVSPVKKDLMRSAGIL